MKKKIERITMIIDILHAAAWIISVFYGFIFSKNWFDMYYLYFTVLAAIHWTILKGECCLSLMDKWKEDPTYVMGSSPAPTDLLDTLGKKHSNYVRVFWNISLFLKVLNLYIVLQRNQIKHSGWISFVFLIYFLKKINTYLYHFPFCVLFIIILFNLKR